MGAKHDMVKKQNRAKSRLTGKDCKELVVSTMGKCNARN
jgi:hypothetical protein